MSNSGKKICTLRDKKINIQTIVLSEKKILNETINHNPPCKLNGRSLRKMYYIDCVCFNFNVFYICIEPGDHIISNYRHKITKYANLNEF